MHAIQEVAKESRFMKYNTTRRAMHLLQFVKGSEPNDFAWRAASGLRAVDRRPLI